MRLWWLFDPFARSMLIIRGKGGRREMRRGVSTRGENKRKREKEEREGREGREKAREYEERKECVRTRRRRECMYVCKRRGEVYGNEMKEGGSRGG